MVKVDNTYSNCKITGIILVGASGVPGLMFHSKSTCCVEEQLDYTQ